MGTSAQSMDRRSRDRAGLPEAGVQSTAAGARYASVPVGMAATRGAGALVQRGESELLKCEPALQQGETVLPAGAHYPLPVGLEPVISQVDDRPAARRLEPREAVAVCSSTSGGAVSALIRSIAGYTAATIAALVSAMIQGGPARRSRASTPGERELAQAEAMVPLPGTYQANCWIRAAPRSVSMTSGASLMPRSVAMRTARISDHAMPAPARIAEQIQAQPTGQVAVDSAGRHPDPGEVMADPR